MTEAAKDPAPAAPIIVALDDMEESGALRLARGLTGLVWGYKVNDLLLRAGADVIGRLAAYGRVFCDAKLHDIPNTVAHQVGLLADAGADLITVHCSGGPAMLAAAREARRGGTRLLGVTVLTAFSDETTQEVYGRDTATQVRRFAEAALREGLDGIICSPADLEVVAAADPERSLLRVTPGIRPAWHQVADDQQRVLTPAAAIAGGADLLVVGRPITAAQDPRSACERIVEELQLPES